MSARLLFVISVMASLLLCTGGERIKYIVDARDSSSGLWEIGDEVDALGSLLAIQLLKEYSSDAALPVLLKAQSAAAALPRRHNHLFESLLRVIGPISSASGETESAGAGDGRDAVSTSIGIAKELSEYRRPDGGWALEAGSGSHPLCTAWALVLGRDSLPAEWVRGGIRYLLSPASGYDESQLLSNTRFRQTLLVTCALARCWRKDAFRDCFHEEWADAVVSILKGCADAFSMENQENALMAQISAILSDWETASICRQNLLEWKNEDSGWGEIPYEPDLVTTCLAIMGLNEFRFNYPERMAELTMTSENPQTSDGKCGALLFNRGNLSADSFQVTIYAMRESDQFEVSEAIPVKSLAAGRSIRLVFSIPSDARFLLVVADEEGAIQETDREDNLLFIPLAPNEANVVHLSDILVNGQAQETPIFLTPGVGARLSATLFYAVIPQDERYRWVNCAWKVDGEYVAYSRSRIGDNHTAVFQFDWFPEKGHYEVELEAFTILGTKYRRIPLHFSYDSSLLFSKRLMGTSLQYCDTFIAREYVDFFAYCSFSDTSCQVRIFKDGRLIGQAAKVTEHHYQFFTRSWPPGEYCAIASFVDPEGNELSSAEHPFSIEPYSHIENAVIRSPAYPVTLYTHTPFPLEILLEWGYVANLPREATWQWRLLDANDTVQASSPIRNLTLTETEYSKSLQLTEAEPLEFTIPGLYRFTAGIQTGEESISDTVIIQVMQAPTLTLENAVTPECIDENEAIASTYVRLSATPLVSLGIPYSFQVPSSPLFMQNGGDETITITLTEIRDLHSLPILEGNLIAAVKYGRLLGGSPLCENRPEGDAILLSIENATATFRYTAGNGVLEKDEYATIPIELFRCTTDGKPLPPRLGVVEVHLSGKEE